MTLTKANVQEALRNTREQRERLWAEFNQCLGAEKQLEIILLEIDTPSPPPDNERIFPSGQADSSPCPNSP